MKKPLPRSTAELARQLGVSRWTVSRALNGHAGIQRETAEKILKAAEESGFAPSFLGRGLRSGKTQLVGLCIPDLVDYFLTPKISHLRKALEAEGMHVMLQMTDGRPEEEAQAVRRFAAMRCRAIITAASHLPENSPLLAGLKSEGIPAVHIDPETPLPGRISTDRAAVICKALEHLYELGHRKMAFLGLDDSTLYGQQRISGLKRGCAKLKLALGEDVQILPRPAEGNDFQIGETLGREVVRRKEGITGVIALNDRMSLGAVSAFRAAGWKVPEDISLIGYDNAEFTEHMDPPLTTFDPELEKLTTKVLKLLNAPAGKNADSVLRIEPRLIVRHSTAKPKRL